MQAELALDARARLGEGALWHEDRLLWVDIESGRVNRFDPATGHNESWPLGQRVGTVVPRSSGGLVVAAHRGIGFLDTETGGFETFVDPEGRPELRFNDGKCDPRGRLFVGSIGLTKPRAPGSLFRIDPDRTAHRLLGGLGTSNGLAWSHDQRTFYFIDTPTYEVTAFDYNVNSGAIENRRPVVRFSSSGPGRPDGMTIDADGNLWVALYEGGGVAGCDPRTGEIFARIEVPAARTTSCAFGGPDLRDLYITTASEGATADQLAREPHAGGIFVARLGPRGVTAFAFAG